MPAVTSTFFGLSIAYLSPGFVGLFSLKYFFPSTNRVFETFLTSRANFGLFLFVVLGALVVGLVVAAVRWVMFEEGLERVPRVESWVGHPASEEQRKGRMDAERLTALRAAVDETYRYHQFYGGLAITLPALFVGWIDSRTDLHVLATIFLWTGFGVLEIILAVGALDARRRYYRDSRIIFSDASIEKEHQ